MLDDLRDISLVTSTDFSQDTLEKVDRSSVHPIEPEYTYAVAKGREIRLDHAKCAMHGPENKEYDE